MTLDAFLVGSSIEFVLLLFVIPIAQRLADFSLPPLGQMIWKLALIVMLKNIVAAALGIAMGEFTGSIGGAIVFWVGLWKVFDLDVFGAIMIVVVSWLLRMFVIAFLVGFFLASA